MNASLPLTYIDRFAWIMRELQAVVAARIRFPPVTGAIILHICGRLRKIAAEFSALAARIQAGTYAPRPAGRCRVARRTSRKGQSPVWTHYELGLPPWQAGWLHRIAPNEAGVWASALRDLFSEPGMAALIGATPRMRRILRPLCFMLGLEASLLTPRPAPGTPAVAGIDAEQMPVAPEMDGAPKNPPTADTVVTPFLVGGGADVVGTIFSSA